MKQEIYSRAVLALMVKRTESAIRKAITTSEKNGKKTIKFGTDVFFFKKIDKKYIFSKSEFIIKTDVNLDLKIDLDSGLEDVKLNISVNGVRI